MFSSNVLSLNVAPPHRLILADVTLPSSYILRIEMTFEPISEELYLKVFPTKPVEAVVASESSKLIRPFSETFY